MNNKKYTEVVVAALINKRGEILLSTRPAPKVYAGYWELPGGKVEKDESLQQALIRELQEELGVTPIVFEEVDCEEFSYPHADVRLHFFRCTDWKGEITCKEGQVYGFFSEKTLPVPILPATVPLLPSLINAQPNS